MSLKDRRRELREWNFGDCICARCLEEEAAGENGKATDGDGDAAARPEVDVSDLERELRQGLGLR